MKEQIRRFLHEGGDFDALACALFRWQRARNPAYAAMAAGAEPTRAEEIPAVPVALFKALALRSYPPGEPERVFRTSGTTGTVRGAHHLRDTELYDEGALAWFRACVPDAPRRVVSFCPTEADSSLGHMVGLFGEVEACFSPAGLAPDSWARLRDPVFVASTAFALDALFAMEGEARLGASSLLMLTGGFKGRRVRLDHAGLYAAVADRLGAPRVVAEYGMTELSSQLWTRPVPAGQQPGPFRAPPWLRVYAADPGSGRPVEGVGVLRFVDLCNLHSVLAIETMDLGRVDAEGVHLHGRLEGAEARGCSLRAEDLLGRVDEA